METPPPVIPYASSQLGKPRVTFRGGLVTLIAGGALLLISMAFIFVAWSILEATVKPVHTYVNTSSLEAMGVFVCVLAGITFIAGIIVFFIGLRGVREREA